MMGSDFHGPTATPIWHKEHLTLRIGGPRLMEDIFGGLSQHVCNKDSLEQIRMKQRYVMRIRFSAIVQLSAKYQPDGVMQHSTKARHILRDDRKGKENVK